MGPVLVAMTLGIPAAILTESGLSFLGLGVQPPYATWGNILNEGKDAIEIAWWLSVYPGVAILVTVLSYNLLGEGVRDALDPAPPPGGWAIWRARGHRVYSDSLDPIRVSRSGGTGRRARLRGVWGNPWGFESPLRHHPVHTVVA